VKRLYRFPLSTDVRTCKANLELVEELVEVVIVCKGEAVEDMIVVKPRGRVVLDHQSINSPS
jgi:hypothetical protein